jgi:hypothetical protein
MRAPILILLLLIAITVSGRFMRGAVKKNDYQKIKDAIKQKISATIVNGVRILIPGLIRLAFHDCIEGCDGCINYNQTGNRGLDDIIARVEPLYKNTVLKTEEVLSRADFWALCALTAVELSVDVNNNIFCANNTQIESCTCPKPRMRFLAGRKDCVTSPHTDDINDIPGNNMTRTEFADWWSRNFGCSPNQGVALMGFHSLGRASSANINGVWEAGNQDGLSTKFYQNIEDRCKEWRHVVHGEGEDAVSHWVGRNNSFALNCDMSMFINYNIMDNGTASCLYEKCPRSPQTAGMLGRYANDCNNWMRHINWLFPIKVLENGYHLHRVR